MRVKILSNIYTDDPEIKRNLAKGNIVRVYIAEHNKNEESRHGWFLVHTGVDKTGIHQSDREVRQGAIIRTYQDPELNQYRNGPYMWINQNEAEIVHESNKEAKYLLKQFEWRV